MRSGARRNDQVRNAKITRNYIKHAEGSVLIEVGDTKVICTASIEEKVPPFLKVVEKVGLQLNIICYHVLQQLENQEIYQG